MYREEQYYEEQKQYFSTFYKQIKIYKKRITQDNLQDEKELQQTIKEFCKSIEEYQQKLKFYNYNEELRKQKESRNNEIYQNEPLSMKEGYKSKIKQSQENIARLTTLISSQKDYIQGYRVAKKRVFRSRYKQDN